MNCAICQIAWPFLLPCLYGIYRTYFISNIIAAVGKINTQCGYFINTASEIETHEEFGH